MGLPLIIFNAALTGAFQASDPFALPDENQTATLHFREVVTVAATVQWYFEFCHGDPNDLGAQWFRETAQESAGGGNVSMPEVVRSVQANGGGTLGAGTHFQAMDLVRKETYARLQVKVSAGTVTSFQATAVYGVPTV